MSLRHHLVLILTLQVTLNGIAITEPPAGELLEYWFSIMSEEQYHLCSKDKTCSDTWYMSSGLQCCGSCKCDSNCAEKGLCCLGSYDNFTHGRQSVENNRYGCVLAQYFPSNETDYWTESRYWMITKCSLATPKTSHRKQCETPTFAGSFENIAPVTHVVSKSWTHYKNKHCAYCNGIEVNTRLISWNMLIESHQYIPVLADNFADRLKQDRGNIIYVKPEYVYAEGCEVPLYSISSCNETGLWHPYNKTVEAACNAYIDPFNATYKNYFCYICNTAHELMPDILSCGPRDAYEPKTHYLPPFFAILDIDTATGQISDDTISCDKEQFKDEYHGICRNIGCHDRRKLSNGRCIPRRFPKDLAIKCIGASLKLIPKETDDTILLETLNHTRFENAIKETLLSRIYKTVHSTGVEFTIFYQSNKKQQLEYIVINLLAAVSEYRSEYFYYVDSIVEFHGSTLLVKVEEVFRNTTYTFLAEVAVYKDSFNGTLDPITIPSTQGMLDTTIAVISDQTDLHICSGINISLLNKLYVCPFLCINIQEMSAIFKNDYLYFSDDQNVTTKTLSKWEYELHPHRVCLCLEDFLDLYEVIMKSEAKSEPPINAAFVPKNILSLACICLSTVCLLLTILIYSCIPALQSKPGINNLILCVFLLLAQTVFQFGVGQTSLTDIACSVIGATSHFLWLAVIFTMNICCIQMFLIFKKQIKMSSKFNLLETIRYLVYIISASLGFVGINFVISYSISDGKQSAYGGKICYISSGLMQLITFVIPSAITTVINILLFFYVVWNIRQIGASTARLNKERNYLGVYARLSSLTGITWTFGYLRLLTGVEVFEYLFIIFNACQGVFIMIAFVLNQRVWAHIFKKRMIVSQTILSEGVITTGRESIKSTRTSIKK